MDNLSLMPLEDAKAYLERLGMNPLVKYEFSDLVDKGSIVRTEPGPNTELKDGQTVWLVCSSGPVIETAQMPRLIGLNYTTAKKQLENLGFQKVTYVIKESKEDKDDVIAQPYPEGTMIDVTEEIVLTISKGPRQTEPPTEAPTEKPTEAPTEPATEASAAQEEKTVTIILELPADMAEPYSLVLYHEKVIVLEEKEVPADLATMEVTFTGFGTVSYDMYINGDFYKTIEVKFS